MSSVRTRALRLRPCGVTGLHSSSFRGRFAGTGAWCWQQCEGPGTLSSSLPVRFQRDREVVLAAVRQDGDALGLVSVAFQADRVVVLTAVLQCGHSWHSASEALQADREVALAAYR